MANRCLPTLATAPIVSGRPVVHLLSTAPLPRMISKLKVKPRRQHYPRVAAPVTIFISAPNAAHMFGAYNTSAQIQCSSFAPAHSTMRPNSGHKHTYLPEVCSPGLRFRTTFLRSPKHLTVAWFGPLKALRNSTIWLVVIDGGISYSLSGIDTLRVWSAWSGVATVAE